jgi:hypothetical protein
VREIDSHHPDDELRELRELLAFDADLNAQGLMMYWSSAKSTR